MRIAIDYTPALRQGAGIGRYTRGLVDGLHALAPADAVTLLVAADAVEGLATSPPPFPTRRIPLTSRHQAILWHRLHLPLPADWFAGEVDIYHSPDFVLPPLGRARGVMTVHDLSFRQVPDCADPGLRRYLDRAVPHALHRAARILADSHSTQHDLVTLLDVDPAHIDVVYPGVGPAYQPVSDEAQRQVIRQRYGLDRPFIFSVGTLEPRKNYSRLIQAYATVQAHERLPHQLVIAGGQGWLYQSIFDTVQQLGLQANVRFLGYVDETDLPTLYSLADAFAFPSRYEGFGIPVIEAMACGTPVVTANNSSLPEAAGDAALLVAAEDVDGLAQAIGRLLTDEVLRTTLRQRGFSQAANFTWTAAAQSLLQAYAHTLEDA
jgi:glycosyltransferase involved in cell wall biosynthesis